MSQMAFSDSDISNFLTDIIGLGGCHLVDESPDKYIRNVSDNETVTMKVNDVSRPLAIYGTKAAESIVINPFAEGEAESSRISWFYSSRNTILGALIVKIMKELMLIALESKTKKKKEGETLERNLVAAKFLKNQAMAIDEKMIKELETVSRALRSFLNIYYDKTDKRGRVNCVLITPAQRKAHSGVRVKSWGVFEKLLYSILDINDLNDLEYIPKLNSIPVFESFSNILVNMYSKLSEALAFIEQPVDKRKLDSLFSHLKYLEPYFARAKWCVSPSVPEVAVSKSKGVVPQVPWGIGSTVAPIVGPGTVAPIVPPSRGYSVPQLPNVNPIVNNGIQLPTISRNQVCAPRIGARINAPSYRMPG